MTVPGMVTFTTPTVAPSAEVVLTGYPEPPGLYLHVPFCSSICPFCPYNKVRYRADLVGRYFTALEREADLYAAAATAPFGSIYIGGGTPTLCLDELENVLARLEHRIGDERSRRAPEPHDRGDRRSAAGDGHHTREHRRPVVRPAGVAAPPSAEHGGDEPPPRSTSPSAGSSASTST